MRWKCNIAGAPNLEKSTGPIWKDLTRFRSLGSLYEYHNVKQSHPSPAFMQVDNRWMDFKFSMTLFILKSLFSSVLQSTMISVRGQVSTNGSRKTRISEKQNNPSFGYPRWVESPKLWRGFHDHVYIGPITLSAINPTKNARSPIPLSSSQIIHSKDHNFSSSDISSHTHLSGFQCTR